MTPAVNPQCYQHHRFPPEIISHAVWLYFRFSLRYRDVEEMMFARGISVTYEAIRKWCRKFGQDDANQIRRCRPRTESRRNKKAAKKFFRKLLKRLQYVPRVVITDKVKSYGTAKREILPGVAHRQSRYLNNVVRTRTGRRASASVACKASTQRVTRNASYLRSVRSFNAFAHDGICCRLRSTATR